MRGVLSHLKWTWIFLGIASLGLAAGPSSPPVTRRPDSFRYANQLLPAVVSFVGGIARGGSLERKPPVFVAVATGKDEYIYHLADKVFMRCIKDRYEMPTWRICGDFAVVRVELMDESMKTLPPIMSWYWIYRDDRWQRLMRDDEGRFIRENFNLAELPPYADRCFDLSPVSNAH